MKRTRGSENEVKKKERARNGLDQVVIARNQGEAPGHREASLEQRGNPDEDPYHPNFPTTRGAAVH
ncbi:hypothetical protein SCOR_32675 [Sulfidibacter corallicola]